MPDPRYYSRGTLAALVRLSGGTCYWPEPRCLVPVTVEVNGEHIFNLAIAHIRAAKFNGPRYVKAMSDDERRMFGNLILLCGAHHVYVDSDSGRHFTIDTLEGWKRKREGAHYDELKNLPGIDEIRLQEILSDALRQHTEELKEQVSRLDSAITRLAEIDAEAASLLRDRMRTAVMLRDAGSALQHTEDTSWMLREAARSLLHTQDTAEILLHAAQALSRFQGTADHLFDAAESFGRFEGMVSQFSEAVASLDELAPRLSEFAYELRRYTDSM
jgi:hypothetical protein